MPMLDDETESLNQLLLDVDLAWVRFEDARALEDYHTLRDNCKLLQERFERWQSAQAPEIQPIPVTELVWHEAEGDPAVGRWPGRVDTYFDLYVASIWNIARTARLLLFTLDLMLSEKLDPDDNSIYRLDSVTTIIEDMISSIPYHLSENIYDFLKGSDMDVMEPGRTLGGFLLMYPVHIASRTPFISMEMRNYLENCLLWMTSYMGIGQASILAKVKSLVTLNLVL